MKHCNKKIQIASVVPPSQRRIQLTKTEMKQKLSITLNLSPLLRRGVGGEAKKLLLITLLYFSPLLLNCLLNHGGGNVFASQQKLDSLNKELKKHHANDIQKLKIYNKLAWYYQYVQIDSSLSYAKKAIALAKDIKNLEGLTEAYNISGLILSRTGNDDVAISEINKSIELNNNVSQQNLAFSYALLLSINGQYGNDSFAKSEYSKAFAIYSKLQDETGIAILNTNYCVYLRTFDLNKALEYNRKALAGFSKTREDEWLSYSYAMQAGIFNLNSQYDSSLFYAQKSEEINNRLGLPNNQIHVYGIRSLIYQSQANYPLAIKNILMAIRYCEKGGDISSLDYCLNNIAWCYNEIGDFEKSLHYLKLQLPIAQSRNDLYTLSGCYQEFGNVYLKQKNFKQALIEYSKAMDASLKMNFKDRIGECHRMLGDAHNGLHRYDSALYHYSKAIKIDKEIGSQWEYCKTLISVAQTLNEIPDQSLKGELPMRLSTDLNTDRGISYALEALELVLKTGELDLQRDAYKVLSDLYESKNEINKSFDYYKKYNAINDSIKNTENTKSITNLQLQYDSEKQEQQIALLNKDKELQQEKIEKQKATRNALIGGFTLMLLLAGVTYNRYRLKQKANNKIEKTLTHLKNTQEQLIQQGKLAALGKMTSEVAMEIQNPLHDVKVLSSENELLVEAYINSKTEEERNNILDKLEINFDAITQHGKMADGIVKNVLMQSRR